MSERNGNDELALKMFKAYLTLKPDAQDKEEVKGKVKALEDKMAASEASAPTENASADQGGEKPPEPPKEELAPPPEPKPPRGVRTPEPEPEPEAPSHAVEWIVGGASVASLVRWHCPQPRRTQQDERLPGRSGQAIRYLRSRTTNAIPPGPWPTPRMSCSVSRRWARRWTRFSFAFVARRQENRPRAKDRFLGRLPVAAGRCGALTARADSRHDFCPILPPRSRNLLRHARALSGATLAEVAEDLVCPCRWAQ